MFQVKIQYRFEVQQNLKFEVYDIDSLSVDLKDHDFLGDCETTVGYVSYKLRYGTINVIDEFRFIDSCTVTLRKTLVNCIISSKSI